MEKTQSLVALYGTLATVFVAGAIVFLLLSALLFFKFDIKIIWQMKSGKAMKRSIKELETVNAQTGRLIAKDRKYDPNKRIIELSKELGRTSESVGAGTTSVLTTYENALPDGAFTIIRSIVLTHTSEII